MLEAQNIIKSFGAVKAVNGASFRIQGGDIFGLIGPNGAGKTTMMRMVMNIIAPDSGEIRFKGRGFQEGDKARIGYLPEERGLYRKATVEDSILYIASLKGMTRTDARSAMKTWLGRFGLSERSSSKVEELSKGNAQKVQFIASVVHGPELALFDEPFSGLDPMSQELLLSIMLELKAKGTAVIFSTHVMEHAEKICERILLVDRGISVADGTLADIKAKYGRNAVQIEFDGNADFATGLPFVESTTAYPRWMETELKPGADPDELFRALAGRVRVRRFEVVSPSLHKIFIKLVGGDGRSEEVYEQNA